MDKENIDPAVDSAVGQKRVFKFKFKPLTSQFTAVDSKATVSIPSNGKSVVEEKSTSKAALPNDGVPNNVGSRGFVGKAMGDSDSSDDENDESLRVRRQLEAERLKKNPDFDPFDPKFYVVQYTRSGKPYRKSTKPYWAWAANTYGYLRYQTPPKKKAKVVDNGLVNGPNDSGSDDDGDELGLHTIAFPMTVKSLKDDIAREMAKDGKFEKSVNEVFRERYYIELPYCRWCDTRPCACYV